MESIGSLTHLSLDQRTKAEKDVADSFYHTLGTRLFHFIFIYFHRVNTFSNYGIYCFTMCPALKP